MNEMYTKTNDESIEPIESSPIDETQTPLLPTLVQNTFVFLSARSLSIHHIIKTGAFFTLLLSNLLLGGQNTSTRRKSRIRMAFIVLLEWGGFSFWDENIMGKKITGSVPLRS